MKEMSKEEITATYNAVAKTVENLNSLQSSFQKITLKQRALGGKVKGITYDIWASMQILVTEGLVSPTSPVRTSPLKKHQFVFSHACLSLVTHSRDLAASEVGDTMCLACLPWNCCRLA